MYDCIIAVAGLLGGRLGEYRYYDMDYAVPAVLRLFTDEFGD